MEAIREQYGLTALRIGYSQGTTRSDPRLREVTCSLRSPASGTDDWWIPADGIGLLASSLERDADADAGIEAGLSECLNHLEASPSVNDLKAQHDPLWLAVTAEHPLLPGVAWEEGLGALGLPLLRLPGQLNTAPTGTPRLPRVALCVSMPLAKARFMADDLVGHALDSLATLPVSSDVHVFADAEWTSALQSRFGTRATIHDPTQEGPHEPVGRSRRPGGDDRHSEVQPWLAWVEEQMRGRLDVLHLIGHGFLSAGQGAFAVAEAPDRNYDTATARFVWPQQIAGLMTSTGAWGLVVTATPQNHSLPGLRLLAGQVSALRSAATAFHDPDRLQDPGGLETVYRLLLSYPAEPPADTRGLMLIMHPGRFGLQPAVTTEYRPAQTDLSSWVDSGEELPAWMVGAQHQVRQWETELSFDSTAGQVEATRNALEVAKSRLDAVMREARHTDGADPAGGTPS
jgi:hypothetical protein